MATAASARARVRAEITAEILRAAEEELAVEGAAALSLRAVARRVDMVPSALYRYFPSRDALLTELIVAAYEAVGKTAETADRAAADAGKGPLDRWMEVARAVRAWARAQPQRWALIYGSPVPGYAAPRTTVEAALRITRVIAALVPEGGAAPRAAGLPEPPPGFEDLLEPTRSEVLPGRPAPVVAAALMAWTALIGTVSMEVAGHYVGATAGDFDPVFDYAMQTAGRLAGLADQKPPG